MAIKRAVNDAVAKYLSEKIENAISKKLNIRAVADSIAKDLAVTIDEVVAMEIKRKTKKTKE